MTTASQLPAGAPGLGRPQVNRWLIASAVMSSAVMEVLDTSVVNVSLPHIAGSLSATVDEATGVTISSVLCGLAPNLPALIFFRILQGTTGGRLQPLSQAVLLEEFPLEERGKAMGFWGLGIVAAPILGPTLGGWLTQTYSWRWVFYINLPIGLASLIMISLFLYDPPYIRRGSLRVDLWGLGMLVVDVGALQIMLDKGQEDDWFGSHFIVMLAVTAGVMLTAFVIRELHVDNPIVHFRLLKYRSFGAGVFLAQRLRSNHGRPASAGSALRHDPTAGCPAQFCRGLSDYGFSVPGNGSSGTADEETRAPGCIACVPLKLYASS